MDDQSHEITVIPQWLDLRDCTVTLDAIGGQTAIAERIRNREGHYVLALNANQMMLHADVQPSSPMCEQTNSRNMA